LDTSVPVKDFNLASTKELNSRFLLNNFGDWQPGEGQWLRLLTTIVLKEKIIFNILPNISGLSIDFGFPLC
jgi:hypothetical protein